MFQTFTISCVTCGAMLRVERQEAIGQILSCPQCNSMVQIQSPDASSASDTEKSIEVTTDKSVPVEASQPSDSVATPETATVGTLSTLPKAPPVEFPQWFLLSAAAAAGIFVTLGIWAAFKTFDPEKPPQTAEQLATNTVTEENYAATNPSDSPSTTTAVGAEQEPSDQQAAKETGPADSAETPAVATLTDNPKTTVPPDEETPKDPVANPEAPAADSQDVEKQPKHIAKTHRQPLPLANKKVDGQLETELIEINLEEMPMKTAMAILSQLVATPIQIDSAALARVGLNPSVDVQYQGEARRVRNVLEEVLAPLGLVAVGIGDKLVITLPDPDDNDLTQVTYDPPPSVDATTTAEWLQNMVKPESWKRGGGRGTIQLNETKLLISQTPAIHGQIQLFLTRLQQRGREIDSPHTPSDTDKTATIATTLAKKVDCGTDGPVPLADYLRQLGSRTNTEIFLDELELLRNGISPNHPVTVEVSDHSLQSLLDELLQPLGLVVRPLSTRSLLITIPEHAQPAMQIHFYPLPKAGNGKELLDAIRSNVAPNSWYAAGGKGRLALHAGSNNLIVLQHPEVQQQLARYLTNLR